MLTEEEKEHIKQEEIFRQEVQIELQRKKHSPESKIWLFFNSNFGIWLLSSVILGLITWSYNEWQQNNLEENRNKEQYNRLSTEIVSRLASFELDMYKIGNSNLDTIDAEDYKKVFAILKKPTKNSEYIIYPEFSNRGLNSLLHELRTFTPKEFKPEITKTRYFFNDLIIYENYVYDLIKKDRISSKSQNQLLPKTIATLNTINYNTIVSTRRILAKVTRQESFDSVPGFVEEWKKEGSKMP